MTTPAIEALKAKRSHLVSSLRGAEHQRRIYQGYVDRYSADVAKCETEIVDIDKAIEALSYPGDES